MNINNSSRHNYWIVTGAVVVIFMLSYLAFFPAALNGDEANILFWGKFFLSQKEWHAYAIDQSRWEVLPGYLYGFFELIGLPTIRPVPFVVNLLELYVTYLLFKKTTSKMIAICAVLFLATMPWHLYYSCIVGTCSVISCLVMLSFYYRDRLIPGILLQATGLLTYTVFRIFWFWNLIACFKKLRELGKNRLLIFLFSAALFVFLVAISKSPLLHILTRGTYNFTQSTLEPMANYLASTIFPLTGFPRGYALRDYPAFNVDAIHVGLNLCSSNLPVVGFLMTPLILVGIPSLYRRSNGREFVFFTIAIWMVLGFMGPSLTRFLFITPFLALMAAYGFLQIRQKLPGILKNILLPLLVGSAILQNSYILYNLQNRALVEPTFAWRFPLLAKEVSVKCADIAQRYLVPARAYRLAAYWAQKTHEYEMVWPFSESEAVEKIKRQYDGRVQVVIFDRPPPSTKPELVAKYYRGPEIEILLKQGARVLEEGEFSDMGRTIGTYLKIVWNK